MAKSGYCRSPEPTVGVAGVDGEAVAAGVGGVDVGDANLTGVGGRVVDGAAGGEEDVGARFVLVQVDHFVVQRQGGL